MKLPEQAVDYVRQQVNDNTRNAYLLDLSKWFRFLGERAPDVGLVVAFREQLERDYSPNTARRIYSTVRSYYDWLRKSGIGTINPFELVKRPKVIEDEAPNTPTNDQVARIMEAVHEYDETPGQRHVAIMCLLLNGLRASEVASLRCMDYFVDDATKASVVRVVGKGMYERIVPLTGEADDALRRYVQSQIERHGPRKPTDPLIQDAIRGPLTRKQVAYVCSKYGDLAGVIGFTPHSFRHHYGTRLYDVTHDILGVGRLMGHRKMETTKRYVRRDLADLVKTARMDPRYG